MKKIIFLLFVVLLIVGCNPDIESNEELAKCLTENGAKMYGTSWCGHCKDQKALFGDDFQYVDYVDCDENKEACQSAGIPGYPTWIIDGEQHVGGQTLEKLASLTGC